MLTPDIESKFANFKKNTISDPNQLKHPSILMTPKTPNHNSKKLVDIFEIEFGQNSNLFFNNDQGASENKSLKGEDSICPFQLFDGKAKKDIDDVVMLEKKKHNGCLGKRNFEESYLSGSKPVTPKQRKRKNEDYHKVIRNLGSCIDSLQSNGDFYSLISQNPFAKLQKISTKLESIT